MYFFYKYMGKMGSRKKERKKETRTLFRIASWFGHMVFQDGRALQPRTVAAETVLRQVLMTVEELQVATDISRQRQRSV